LGVVGGAKWLRRLIEPPQLFICGGRHDKIKINSAMAVMSNTITTSSDTSSWSHSLRNRPVDMLPIAKPTPKVMTVNPTDAAPNP